MLQNIKNSPNGQEKISPMDEDKNKNKKGDETEEEVSEEEKKSEEEALTEVKDEELRKKVAEDVGIDPEDEPELLDKLVEREKGHRSKLSGAIKQKISWRDEAKKSPKKDPKGTPEEGETQDEETPTGLSEEDVDKRIDEREAKRDLEKLDLPEEIETEVKDLSKLKGISVREAAELPYIKGRIEEVETAERIKSGTPKRSSKGSYSSKVDPSKPLDPADFNLDTKEGRKDWKTAKAARRQHEKENKE